MDRHYGQVVEYIVRKVGFNISELAKGTDVNRRTLYNWFKQKDLKSSVIFRIGCVIKHDFGREFPELFTAGEFNIINELQKPNLMHISNISQEEESYWKFKYFTLLEEINVTFPKEEDSISN
ncbi:hypothetical protein [Mucilaginibacter sp.]|uniref:hypothetical protein n=1 Tax=Mucilaginibacter sp. TaxID=1882438 RepID=UPI0026192009|nr:hypothetical protein [Mucilaginibacter sp.]MDB4919462.1 hypothetical protein [Mucilaginibacter sp.]